MRKFITSILLIAALISAYIYRDKISEYLLIVIRGNHNITLDYKNEYTRDFEYKYVKITNKFNVESKHELINVYYTIINSGIDEFSFYCSKKYESCINDVIYLADNQEKLSIINNFVHPYNSFNTIETVYDTLGKVTLRIVKAYSKEQINTIENKVQEVIRDYIKDTTDKKEIIKIVHDYIVNNTKYDSDRSDKNIIKYASDIAYGPLIEGYAICGGYTDALSIFIDKYDIPNMSISSENHIWNSVLLDNKWLHLDLTWDDPIASNNKDILDYTYFLITTEQLHEEEKTQHNFDKTIFLELAM